MFLYLAPNNMKDFVKCINHDLQTLNEWFKVNRLSLHAAITNLVDFTKTELHISNIMHLKIGTTIMKSKSSLNFLGVNFDSQFSWQHHTENIIN